MEERRTSKPKVASSSLVRGALLFMSVVAVIFGLVFALAVLCIVLAFSIAWAVMVIWALNILGLHVAYGASEVIAVMILSGLAGRFH